MNSVLHRLQTLSVADVMAREVVEISVDQSMHDVAALFVEHGISAAPVVDVRGRCVGVLSATDFLKRESHRNGATSDAKSEASCRAAAPSAGNAAADSPLSDNSDAVADHMTANVQTIPHTALLLTAARVMCSRHVHRLIVVDDEGHTAGVISTMDVVAALMNAFEEVKTRM